MTRKKFIKTLMAMGVSRNTATASADAASRTGVCLQEVAKRAGFLKCVGVDELGVIERPCQEFDQEVLRQARMVLRFVPPRYTQIRPLAKKKRPDGLRADFVMVDEWSHPGGAWK